jgi:hypothetical protein
VARLAWFRGWPVVRMNMRGSGDGEALCPLPYNALARGEPRAGGAGVALVVSDVFPAP